MIKTVTATDNGPTPVGQSAPSPSALSTSTSVYNAADVGLCAWRICMASRFNIYSDLVISRNELEISTIQLLISPIHSVISLIQLMISAIQ